MQCPNCKSQNVFAVASRSMVVPFSFAACLDCGHRFSPDAKPCDIKVITEAISEPAGIPVTVYERISTGEIIATPTALFNRGRHV